MTFLNELKFALRSLGRAKGLVITVVLTLALGIGANAAIFSVVRGVLLRPLVNREEGRLIYIQQSAQGIGSENTAFSVPEIRDLRQRWPEAEAALKLDPAPVGRPLRLRATSPVNPYKEDTVTE